MFLFPITAGQRHFTNSGCQKFNEFCGADSEDVLYCIHKDYQDSESYWPTTSSGDVENEGSREEAPG